MSERDVPFCSRSEPSKNWCLLHVRLRTKKQHSSFKHQGSNMGIPSYIKTKIHPNQYPASESGQQQSSWRTATQQVVCARHVLPASSPEVTWTRVFVINIFCSFFLIQICWTTVLHFNFWHPMAKGSTVYSKALLSTTSFCLSWTCHPHVMAFAE